MAVTNRGSILISTANDIGSSLVDVIGGDGYSPNEWAKEINICGIAAADIPTALDNIEESTPSGTDRGDISLDTGNAVGAVLNKKFNTARGFKPSEWASAISKLTELEVKTASGAIASFNDGADDVPIESATFEFSPNQDLNGQDAPYPPGGGKNLFNADNIHAHGFWNANGSFTNHESYNAYIIKVDPETDYTYNAGFTGITTFLDSNGDYISGSNQGTGLASRTVTTPANCAYITASISITNLNGTQQIEKGSSATAYAPYANICPITGYEGLTIYHVGKNLYNKDAIPYQTGKYIISTSVIGSTTFTYSGNANYNVYRIKIAPNTTYTISSIKANAPCWGLVNSKGVITQCNPNNGGTEGTTFNITSGVDDVFLYLSVGISGTYKCNDVLQVEKGSAPTAYEPYKSKTPIVDSFGRTVYGGSRATDGTLTETHKIVTYTGAEEETWYLSQSGGVYRFFTTLNDAKVASSGRTSVYCNIGKYSSSNVVNAVFLSNAKQLFYIPPQTVTTVADFKTWLSSNNLQVAYETDAPTISTLSAVNISTYYGGNNVYSDTNGDTTVAYRADIDLSAT